MTGTENRDTKEGFIYAGLAYFIWSLLPLYMKQLDHVPAWEIVAHRVVWSLPIAGLVVWWRGLGGQVAAALANPRMLGMATVTTLLISVNWLVYIWAVTSGRALETALGYYINPLFSVCLAAILVGEKTNGLQKVAIAIAALAVAVLTWENGHLPWVSLALAFTWGFYAYFKKTLAIGPTEGFFLEVLILTPPCIALMLWLRSTGVSHFGDVSSRDTWLLMASSLFTAVPLIFYAMGAKLLRLTTIAIMQYSAPTMIFLTAVFVFGEPFSQTKLVAFLLIWTALAVYTYSLIRPR